MSAAADIALLPRYLCSADNPYGTGGDTIWTFDLWITVPLALSALLYGRGIVRLWRHAGRGRGIHPWQVASYAMGWLVLVVALVSPVHYWGNGFFTIHMIEHELVMAVAAPLIALGRSGGAAAWALPPPLRRAVLSVVRRPVLRRLWSALVQPVTATILHGIAIWVWHVPQFFEATLTNVAIHRLQHVSFLVTGLLFWWALIRRRNPGTAAAHLFATMLHTSVLGALMALAPQVVYRLQTEGALAWGLTPLQDQQLAGLVMWIPAGIVYAGAALLFFGVWVQRSGVAWNSDNVLRQA